MPQDRDTRGTSDLRDAAAAANSLGEADASDLVPLRHVDSLRTRTDHAGTDTSDPVWPLSAPMSPSTVYAFRDPDVANQRSSADPPLPNYVRDGMPNVRDLEHAVADLEGAEAAQAVASGMAAIALLFLAHLHAGDHLVAFSDGYCETGAFIAEELPRFGVRSTLIDADDPDALARAMSPATRMVYVETIANSTLRLADLTALARVTHAHGVLLCVDNTFATPLLCRPLELGADMVVHSATKFLGGHHDLLAGVVAGRRAHIAPLRRCAQLYGSTLSAMDAWLALRGLHTLGPRMAWMSASALTIATYLQTQPAVAAVAYPGLPDSPQAQLAHDLLPDGAGAVLTVTLRGGPPAAATFLRALRLIPYALSLGGTTTTVCYPPQSAPGGMGGSATLRMSVGLEAVDDLIADLAQALAVLPIPDSSASGAHPRALPEPQESAATRSAKNTGTSADDVGMA